MCNFSLAFANWVNRFQQGCEATRIKMPIPFYPVSTLCLCISVVNNCFRQRKDVKTSQQLLSSRACKKTSRNKHKLINVFQYYLYLGTSVVRFLMSSHIPRKRFGQNFLVDQQVIRDIIFAINPSENDVIVEIGPGLGALTRPLLQTLKHLHVVEIDRDIVKRLREEHPPTRLTIHEADALRFDFSSIGDRFRVVGNLPYNISTPLLFHLSEFSTHLIDLHFMLQKEVVERMVATPGTKDYGRLSVMLQYCFTMEYLFTVPPDAFRPAPKVESAIVRMVPFTTPAYPAKNEQLFAKIVAAGFGQRRKTLRNTLHDFMSPEDFSRVAIDPQLRAENLSVEAFVQIANYLATKTVTGMDK